MFGGSKIIVGRDVDDFFQHRLNLLRCIRNLSQKKVHIHGHTAVKIRNRINRQEAMHRHYPMHNADSPASTLLAVADPAVLHVSYALSCDN